jgi:hypothetical protein
VRGIGLDYVVLRIGRGSNESDGETQSDTYRNNSRGRRFRDGFVEGVAEKVEVEFGFRKFMLADEGHAHDVLVERKRLFDVFDTDHGVVLVWLAESPTPRGILRNIGIG